MLDSEYILPVLTALWTVFSPAFGLSNIGRGTCYLNASIQGLVHVPIIANIPSHVWKGTCGCSATSNCWLCYLGIRTASRHGRGLDTESGQPLWALKRLHLLMAPGGSTAKRNKPTPDDPDMVITLTTFVKCCCPNIKQVIKAVRVGQQWCQTLALSAG